MKLLGVWTAWMAPCARCSAMGQLSGIAFTTCVSPACTAACDGQACVPTKGASRGRSENGAVMSSETFWSDAL